ncbi:MAG TPA: NUDIX hydrolase [Erysipelotrichaceae bacterium]|nr:NUDIX hydrolase [Erysipelotrichaceae bacterium]
MDKKEKTIRSREIYRGKVVNLYQDEVLCPNGQISLREIVSHRGGVAILLEINNRFVIEKQYRYAFDEEVYEIPAGKLEEGEEPLESAKRELLEETGYRPLEMIHLGNIYPTCGYSTEIIYIYYCPLAKKEERQLDSDEVIDLCLLSLEEIEKMIEENLIKDSKTIAAISLYKLRFLKNEQSFSFL